MKLHNDYSYEIDSIETLAGSISKLILRPSKLDRISYVAGQYIKVMHNKMVSPLSIANAPNEQGTLEFHLFHPAHNLQAQDLLKSAQHHQEWQLTGPFGRCTVTRLHPERPIIFLARGTGFAPIKAVIEALTKERHYPPLHLYWRMAHESDFYMESLLKNWQDHLSRFRYTFVVFKEENPKERTKFDLLQKTVLRDYPNLQDAQVYASGPASLIYSAVSEFEEHGLPREFFYSDVFG